jgi:hypothetical protein
MDTLPQPHLNDTLPSLLNSTTKQHCFSTSTIMIYLNITLGHHRNIQLKTSSKSASSDIEGKEKRKLGPRITISTHFSNNTIPK